MNIIVSTTVVVSAAFRMNRQHFSVSAAELLYELLFASKFNTAADLGILSDWSAALEGKTTFTCHAQH